MSSFPPIPDLLDAYATQFDDLFSRASQRTAFRQYLVGLLPAERSKTLTALANAEPVVGAQRPSGQRLQWFLSESTWEAAAVTAWRLELLRADPATLPETATWYLATTLPQGTADLAAVVRLYGLRHWIEQQDKHSNGSLGWRQYQVRADRAMRRHWALVQCAFAFCWWAETAPPWLRPGRCWPRALRRVRAWLEPAWVLWRCWRAWSNHPPPTPLPALLDWLAAGHPLDLYDPV